MGLTQHEKILELLRERGAAGASNFELMRISYQYPARIHTLRHKLGHEIEVKHVKDTEWRIRLVKDADAQPKPVQPTNQPRQATLLDVEPTQQRRMAP